MPTREELIAAAGKKWEREQLISQAHAKWDSEQKQVQEQPTKTSGPMSAIESFADTVTLGNLPQIQALIGKLLPNPNAEADAKLKEMGITPPPQESYLEARDRNIKRQELQGKEHPYWKGVGTVGGIVAGGATTGALGRLAGLGKTATALGRFKDAAKIGAVMGAVSNPGDKEGEINPLQLEDRLKSAGIGAGVGMASELASEAIGFGSKKASQYFRNKAEQKAFNALGPDLRAVRQNMSKRDVQKIGRTLLDSGAIKSRASREKMFGLIKMAKEAKGKELESVINELGKMQDDLFAAKPGLVKYGTRIDGVKSGIDRKRIAQSLRDDLISPHLDIPDMLSQNAKVEKLIKEFENGGDELLSILHGEDLKKAVGKQIKWDRLPGTDIPLKEQVRRSLYSKLRQGTEDAAAYMDDLAGNSKGSRFKSVKSQFGNLKEAEKIIEKRLARDTANRLLSPSDYFTGGIGAAAGFASGGSIEDKVKNAAIGASLGLVNKLGRNYGNQITAKMYESAANALFQIPKFAKMAEKNPSEFHAMVQTVLSKINHKESDYNESPKKRVNK